MEQKFTSSRWYGRLLGVLFLVARKNGNLKFSDGSVSLAELLTKVTEVADEGTRITIYSLLQKWNERVKEEETSGISVSAEEAKKQEEIGTAEVMIVYRNTLSYYKLEGEEDFYAAEQERQESEKKRQRKSRFIVFGCIAVTILASIIYNLPYFKEIRCYKDAIASDSQYECWTYYSEYPNGRHYEDVMYHEAAVSLSPISVVTEYLARFPEGKYIDEMNYRCDELWDEVIEKYDARDKSGDSPEAVRYMTEMLHHMKTTRTNTVLMTINPTLSLKDYSEYDEFIRQLLEAMYSENELPLKGNVLSLKENFTSEDRITVLSILSEGVKESFSRMFSSDFVDVVTSASEADRMSPRLTFDYEIKTRTENEDGTIPEIWIYSTNGTPEKYILGIDITFDAHFTIPGSDVRYDYTETGEPGDEIRDILDVRDGYRRMTQICIAKFSDTMSQQLGLSKVYFE